MTRKSIVKSLMCWLTNCLSNNRTSIILIANHTMKEFSSTSIITQKQLETRWDVVVVLIDFFLFVRHSSYHKNTTTMETESKCKLYGLWCREVVWCDSDSKIYAVIHVAFEMQTAQREKYCARAWEASCILINCNSFANHYSVHFIWIICATFTN